MWNCMNNKVVKILNKGNCDGKRMAYYFFGWYPHTDEWLISKMSPLKRTWINPIHLFLYKNSFFFFHFNLFTHISIFRCLTSGQEFKIPDKNKSNNSTIICIFNIWARAFKKRSTLHLLMDADVKKSLQTSSTFSIPYIFYPYYW